MPASLKKPNPARIKVCGIREPAEAAALDAMGAGWLGFNFHPGSKRYVDPEAAAAMARGLRRAVPVGVFVDAPVAHVISVTTATGMRLVQLHGSEDWEYVKLMPVPVIKAIPHTRLADWGGLRSGLEAALASGAGPGPLAYFLVDTAVGAPGAGGEFGGTGKSFDWELLRKHPLPLPYFLAGGLGPENLAEALRIAPFAIDLNSKVELSPGKKDLGKVRACFDLVAAASAA